MVAARMEPVIEPMPPRNDHDHDVDRIDEAELVGVDHEEHVGLQAAGHTGEEGSDREGQELVVGGVDAG